MKQIIFYFDEYTIASGSAGVPIVALPIDRFEQYYCKKFQNTK